jgi:hypothetical protein
MTCQACQKDPLGICDHCLGQMFLDGICLECGIRQNTKYGICEDCHAKDQEDYNGTENMPVLRM